MFDNYTYLIKLNLSQSSYFNILVKSIRTFESSSNFLNFCQIEFQVYNSKFTIHDSVEFELEPELFS